MESNRVRKLYETSSVPTLYVGMGEDLLPSGSTLSMLP
jgi:hypothetical protein